MLSKARILTIVAVVLTCILLLEACGPAATPTAQIVEQTKLVEATQIVESTKLVETTKIVNVEVTPTQSDVWAAADVTKACGTYGCIPLATLPKTFKKPLKIGFVSANEANPFHGAFQQGAKDAAKFYGVQFVDMDAAGGTNMLDLANTMLTQGVMAIGILGQGMDAVDPIGAAAQDKHVVFIPADSGKTDYSPYTYGVADALSGKRGGELLAEGVKKAQAGDWAGKELFFIEATYTAIPACVNRTGGAAKAFQAAMNLDDKHMLKMDAAVGTVTDIIKTILTAHPKAVFGMIPCWDQLGVDPWNVARESKRGDDVMLVTLGGDKPFADLLVSHPKNYYGYVEFQPYCEGWGWVETALAILDGETFTAYVPRTVTTQDTIDARYVALYGALPTPAPSPTPKK
jgi:ABC-type sugar transport system substrate-binding protein